MSRPVLYQAKKVRIKHGMVHATCGPWTALPRHALGGWWIAVTSWAARRSRFAASTVAQPAACVGRPTDSSRSPARLGSRDGSSLAACADVRLEHGEGEPDRRARVGRRGVAVGEVARKRRGIAGLQPIGAVPDSEVDPAVQNEQ